MTNDKIKEIALANGFKLKEQPDGTQDLNPYVCEFARALFAEQQRLWDKERAAILLHEPINTGMIISTFGAVVCVVGAKKYAI